MSGRIEVNPEILLGKPCIAGTRIPVYLILELVACGYTIEQIVEECYPSLEALDVVMALQHISRVVKSHPQVLGKNTPE